MSSAKPSAVTIQQIGNGNEMYSISQVSFATIDKRTKRRIFPMFMADNLVDLNGLLHKFVV